MDQRRCNTDRPRLWPMVHRSIPGIVIALALAAIAVVAFAQDAQAATQANEPAPDSACRLCHIDNDGEEILPSGESLSLGVDPTVLDVSVHGGHLLTDVYCTDCHRSQERYLYPHQPNLAQTLQEFEADVAQNCETCHAPLALHNPGHLGAADSARVPNCVDCHGGHDAAPAAELAADPVGFCLECHQEFDDEQVAQTHTELAANLTGDQDCQSCHNGQPLYPADAQCKLCHTLLESETVLNSGESFPRNVDLATLADSVHGDQKVNGHEYSSLLCTDCHVDGERYQFPHAEVTAPDLRHFSLEMDATCQTCHEDIFALQRDSVHAAAQEVGVLVAATCIDCHGSHSVQDPDSPRERVSQTCGQCHSTINTQYEQSVHGAALLGEQNPDVPVCTDCHGVHDIQDPRTALFRVNSPTMCAECHADVEMMTKYGISTNVFDSYVADFHGTTVELFEKQSPEHETNKAVCYDCHGIHNILPANDENSQVIRENLLVTCQQCHPDADANFPASWTSHFEPSLEHNALVYLVNWFYRLLIPAVLGGFALFIGTDVYRMVRVRRNKTEHEHGTE